MNANALLSRDDLLTDCERSMRYHHARERFLNTAHLFIQFVVFALTTTGTVWLIESFVGEWFGLGLLAAASALALCSLIFRPAEKAGLHRSLYRSFTLLAGAISSTANPDEATRAEWTRNIHALYAEEPPVFRALLAHCDNQVAIALGARHDDDYFVDLKLHQRLLRNFLPFQDTDFLNRSQARQ
ncbi:MAG: hypothetical protein MPK31_07805 [Gammaproteobacteria bacterium]|nr:hypothetical protein [Gammaproteobacteria bacterium]MDA8003159.1 hypothetical protein [Alphaproteobacteria bacterium]